MMDADRYQRIRDLFLEVDEMDAATAEALVRSKAEGDEELIAEVMSLLAEHDADAAHVEGTTPHRPVSASDPLGMTPGGLPTPPDETPNPMSPALVPSQGVSRFRTDGATRIREQDSTAQAQPTLHSAQRTHAVPRHQGTRPAKPAPKVGQTLTSIGPKGNRVNPRWLLGAMTTAAIVGIWITAVWMGRQQQHRDHITALESLTSTLDATTLHVERLLQREQDAASRLAMDPKTREAIERLISANEDPSPDPAGSFADTIGQHWANRLKRDESSLPPMQSVDVIFVNRELQPLVAVSGPDFQPVTASLNSGELPPEGAANIARSLAGRPVLYGPAALADLVGTATAKALGETDENRLAWIVPVRAPARAKSEKADSQGASEVLGVLIVVQRRSYDWLNERLNDLSREYSVDAYLVDHDGVMRTQSIHRPKSAGDQLSNSFRVTEFASPTEAQSASTQSSRSVRPLTIAAASVPLSEIASVNEQPYRTYTGRLCFGGWHWLPNYGLGVIVERDLSSRLFPMQFTWPWAWWMSCLALGMAWLCQRFLMGQGEPQSKQPLGRYLIQGELGSGGMGVVYRATHLELGREIALKVLRGDRQDEDDQRRFDREANLAAGLSSPHSVAIYDYGRDEDGHAFCVMQLLEGLTLSEVVARSGFQSPARAIWIMLQVCQAVLEAHSKGLVHRDLKPQNIMLSFDSVVGDWAVVFDFGLAKPLEPNQAVFQTAETVWAGTPMYMAPERFRAPTVVDPRSDVYSLGCVLYFLLSGRPPFAECDPESMFALILTHQPIELATHRGEPVDEELADLVRLCMAKEKQTRVGSMADLTQRLGVLSERFPWTRQDAHQWWQRHAGEELAKKL